MKKIMMLSAAILALQALPAMAEGGKHDGSRHGPGKFFDKQDTDKDGAVSEAEFMASAKERFTKMDTNNDGKITKDELEAHHAAMKKKWQERKASKGKSAPAVEVTPE